METSVNNKCRAFTSLEQSKKLAEILPLESADMYYEPSTGYCTEPSEVRFGDIKYAHPRSIRCWSLAALLDIFPKIHGVKPILDLEENSIQYTGIDLYVVADNPVDACYEMVIKLHEQKML